MTDAPSLSEYLADLWRRRAFTMSLATGSLRGKYLETTLGNVWHVLNPALLMGVYYLVFGVILGTSRGVENFIGFLAAGVFTYQFSQRTVAACGSSIANNVNLIRSLQFPRAVLPISAVIEQVSGYGFSAAVLVVILVVSGEPPTARWLLAPVVVVLLTMFNAGIGLIVARLTDRIRDVANIIPFVFRLLFYFSGIIFALTTFVTQERLDERFGAGRFNAETVRELFVLDPYFTYIELLRDVVMTSYTAEHPTSAWIAALLFAPVTFVVGVLYFRGGERSYGRG